MKESCKVMKIVAGVLQYFFCPRASVGCFQIPIASFQIASNFSPAIERCAQLLHGTEYLFARQMLLQIFYKQPIINNINNIKMPFPNFRTKYF